MWCEIQLVGARKFSIHTKWKNSYRSIRQYIILLKYKHIPRTTCKIYMGKFAIAMTLTFIYCNTWVIKKKIWIIYERRNWLIVTKKQINLSFSLCLCRWHSSLCHWKLCGRLQFNGKKKLRQFTSSLSILKPGTPVTSLVDFWCSFAHLDFIYRALCLFVYQLTGLI